MAWDAQQLGRCDAQLGCIVRAGQKALRDEEDIVPALLLLLTEHELAWVLWPAISMMHAHLREQVDRIAAAA